MPAPTSYTELSLARYMASVLGQTGTLILLAAPVDADDLGAYQNPIEEVELLSGVSDVADETDILKLRVLARWQAWEMAGEHATKLHDYRQGRDSKELSRHYRNIDLQRKRAALAARKYMPDYKIKVYEIRTSDLDLLDLGDELAP
jgi:hypothetical protein